MFLNTNSLIKSEQLSTKMELFGVKFAPILIPLERRLQTFAVLFWITTFLFMGPLSTSILVWLLWTKYRWITILYITWVIYDRYESVGYALI